MIDDKYKGAQVAILIQTLSLIYEPSVSKVSLENRGLSLASEPLL